MASIDYGQLIVLSPAHFARKLKILAIMEAKRSAKLPDVPTLSEMFSRAGAAAGAAPDAQASWSKIFAVASGSMTIASWPVFSSKNCHDESLRTLATNWSKVPVAEKQFT